MQSNLKLNWNWFYLCVNKKLFWHIFCNAKSFFTSSFFRKHHTLYIYSIYSSIQHPAIDYVSDSFCVNFIQYISSNRLCNMYFLICILIGLILFLTHIEIKRRRLSKKFEHIAGPIEHPIIGSVLSMREILRNNEKYFSSSNLALCRVSSREKMFPRPM